MSSIDLSRRKLFTFAAALIAAPTIVRVDSIMPVRSLPEDELFFMPDYVRGGYGMSFSDMVRETLTANRLELAAQTRAQNALLCRLTEKGLIIV